MIVSPVSSASWKESEVLALRAALSVIGTWDGDLEVLLDDSDNSDSSKSSVSDTTKPTTRDAGTPYRPRARRLQLEKLRAEVQDLQTTVAYKRALAKEMQYVVEAEEALPTEWRQVTDTQQRRRLGAELKNAKLRRRVQSQQTFARQMLKLSKKVRQIERALVLPRLVNYRGPTIDPLIQLRELERLIPRANLVFSSKPFTTNGIMPFELTAFVDSTPPEQGADLETQTQWMLPASVERVAEAMWLQMMRPVATTDKMCMCIHEDANSSVIQFMSTMSFNDDWGGIQGQGATRILPQDLGDGSILIVMTMEAQSVVGAEARGCASFDSWVRIEPVPTPDPVRTGPLSLIKWYRRTLLTSPVAATMTKVERCQWTKAVISGSIRSRFVEELQACMHAVDDLLLASPREVL